MIINKLKYKFLVKLSFLFIEKYIFRTTNSENE